MKRYLTLLALVLWCSGAEATSADCEYFLYPHLNLSYCSNSCQRSDTDMLYYRGLTEALNAYIAKKREEGALQEKKVEVSFVDSNINAGAPVIEISQNRRGYYVNIGDSSDLNLRNLVRLVEYFASKNWQSFCCYYRRSYIENEAARRKLNRIMDREVGQPDMSFFEGRRSVVFEAGALQVIYENDRLFYSLEGKRLNLEPGDPTPTRLGNRYLFGSKNFIHVYERGSQVRRRPKSWELECRHPLRSMAYRKWANLGCGVTRLSYSYDKNAFYDVNAGPVEYRGPNCSDERGGGEIHPAPLRVIN